MRVIVAGSRSIKDESLISEAITKSGFAITSLIHGGALGVDSAAGKIGKAKGLPVRVVKADWLRHGKSAGPIRNRRMADEADALIAVWDGKSAGTADMISVARKKGLQVFVKICN